jgi:curved DNA-binding protein
MTEPADFVDYYRVLQVSPGCDRKILESAYHTLAKLYHPDRKETGDPDRFSEVVEAYRILRDARQREEYNQQHAEYVGGSDSVAPSNGGDEGAAISDADDHARILLYLYKKRRENAQRSGELAFRLQQMLGCTEEHFAFHQWYLKEKGYISLTEQGELAITVEGVDHVISLSRTIKVEKLLLEQQGDDSDGTA